MCGHQPCDKPSCTWGERMSDLTGTRFGRLVVMGRMPSTPHGHSVWRCSCDCGVTKDILGTSLRKGATKSCGCLNAEIAQKRFLTHGKTDTRTYRIWRSMLSRCENEKAVSFKNYGGRGIRVCDAWHDFEGFLADMGECPGGRSIDRIDHNGNYEPGNCQWATHKQQQNNRRDNRLLSAFGKTQTVSQWCDELNLPASTVWLRISKGWPDELVLSKEDRRCRATRDVGASDAA